MEIELLAQLSRLDTLRYCISRGDADAAINLVDQVRASLESLVESLEND